MMVFAVSVTSTPKASLAGAGVAALGAGGGGGGPSGAGIDACANADEATPSASNAARAVARPGTASQKQVIEISLDRKIRRASGSTREESVESTTAAKRRNNRKPVIAKSVVSMRVPSGSGHHLGISHITGTPHHPVKP